MPPPSGMTPLVFKESDDSESSVLSPSQLQSSLCRKYLTKQPMIQCNVKLNTTRDVSIMKWHKILVSEPIAFDLSRAFLASCPKLSGMLLPARAAVHWRIVRVLC